MSIFVRQRRTAFRVRQSGAVLTEDFGPLHRADTMLEWASVTKTVTATLAHKLADSGILSLDDPVTDYLPASRLPQGVDIASLVSHTSGLPRVPADIHRGPEALSNPYGKYTDHYFDHETVPRLRDQHNGTVGNYEYSNLGYAVLTRVMEIAAGDDWWTLARQHVLEPLGVRDVSVDPDPDRIAVLHSWNGTPRSTWVDTGPFVGAGGFLGTFDALEQYALESHRNSLTQGDRAGWIRSRDWWWHNGHNRDQGVFVGVDEDAQWVITVHTLGRRAFTADKVGARLGKTFFT